MVAARKHRLEASRVAEVQALNEAELGELLEGPIDACEPDGVSFGAKPVEDLGRAEAAFLAGEKVDDGAPRLTPAVAAALESRGGAGGPVRERRPAGASPGCLFSHGGSVPVMRAIMVLILLAGAGAVSCGGGADAGPGGQTAVVASFYPLAFAAEEIGGPSVEVTNLTPPGAEPHDVELSVRDVERVRSADLVLYLGTGFQPAVERAVDGADVEAIDLLEGQELLEPIAHGDEEAEEETADPHVWLDPLRYAELATRIGRALGRPGAAEALEQRLRELHVAYEQGLADCERREIVTSHAAFGYLAERYRLEQIAITGVSPEAEPTAHELERVVAQVRERGVTTVFFETLVSPRLAETVAREAGVVAASLNPLEGLTEEELDRGSDYFSVMRDNLATLRKALGCR
jgi:zinc transport system substrate-binding protein